VETPTSPGRTVAREITAAALAEALTGNAVVAVRQLCKLPSVGTATASAILAAVYPDRFGVIDRYAMSEVGYLAAAVVRDGGPPDESLALLVEGLTLWAAESWTTKGAGAEAYGPYTAGLVLRARMLMEANGGAFRPRDIEKAIYGHFLNRTRKRVL
jgi:hypothetical protein